MANSRSNTKKYVVAVVGAVSAAALVGAGVFATTLTVSGSQGTELQAGSDTEITAVAGCETDGITVEEVYSSSTLDPSTGYSTPERTGYTVSGISAGCNGKVLTLAVRTNAAPNANEYTSVGNVTVDAVTETLNDTSRSGTVTGYSVKIA